MSLGLSQKGFNKLLKSSFLARKNVHAQAPSGPALASLSSAYPSTYFYFERKRGEIHFSALGRFVHYFVH